LKIPVLGIIFLDDDEGEDHGGGDDRIYSHARMMGMEERHHTAWEALEIKGSFQYFVFLCILAVVAVVFMVVSKMDLASILRPLSAIGMGIVLAYVIYHRKKRGKSGGALPWIVAFITSIIPVAQKYLYAANGAWTPDAWTFAAESYNSSIMIVVMVVLLYLFYNKRLFGVFAAFSLANWILFFYLAYRSGAAMHIDATVDGRYIHGIIVARELFFFIASVMIAIIAYRNIPILEEYERRSAHQRALIEKQAGARAAMTGEIKEKMGNLAVEVDGQNSFIAEFNQKMESQAATFEEMSATMEELLSSAENIHVSSVNQLDGNINMETIVTEFKDIKQETKKNLEVTFSQIESVVNQTSVTNEKLQAVESTITSIKDQGGKIAETVSIIVDIADKINLLSLNASIEAARAGDYGRGFAVVADEIGKLATQTTDSIKEIERVLSANAKITTDGVEVIRTSAEMIKGLIADMSESSNNIKILQDSILVEEKYIKVIIDQMFKNIELAKNIGMGTEEQKTAIASTSQAIEHVNELVAVMVKEIHELANSSRIILENARALIAKAEEAVS
jgi:methyl-accepting chemotaxis protein